MPNNQPNTKPAGSLPTRWQLRTYDVWDNGVTWEVNDTFSAGEVELRIPQTRYNVGVEWHVCRNPECPGNNPCGHKPACAWGAHRMESHGVIPTTTHNSETGDTRQRCPECWHDVTRESQEWVGAYPSDRQIKRAFGVTCRIETDGDDTHIEVTRARDGYPIGCMECVSHESLSPMRAKQLTDVQTEVK